MKQIDRRRSWVRISPKALGLMFLVPGLLLAIRNLSAGTLTGAALGFCCVAISFGLLLLLAPFRPSRRG